MPQETSGRRVGRWCCDGVATDCYGAAQRREPAIRCVASRLRVWIHLRCGLFYQDYSRHGVELGLVFCADALDASSRSSKSIMTDNRVSLSIKEYAERHGVCTRTVRRWIKAGRVPVQRFSKRTIRIVMSVRRNRADSCGHSDSLS